MKECSLAIQVIEIKTSNRTAYGLLSFNKKF